MRFFLTLFFSVLMTSSLFADQKPTSKKADAKPQAISKNEKKTSEPATPKNIAAPQNPVKEASHQEAAIASKTQEQPLQKQEVSNRASQTKLPLPRFVCIKATVANMHVGPGNNYPVEWKYMRQYLPVEVIAEFEHWRQVRDMQGTVGWFHKSLLSSKRFVIVQQKVANLYTGPDLQSPVLATVEPGVVAKINECFNNMCKVDIQGVKGWIKRDFLFGVYPDEVKF